MEMGLDLPATCGSRTAPWVLRAVAALCALFVPVTAVAGGSYKCVGEDGITAYVNNHLEDFKSCVKIAEYDASPSSSAPSTRARGEWQYRETRANEAPPKPATVAIAAPAKTRILRGAVYKRTDANGITYYTNIKQHASGAEVLFHYIATCTACDVHSKVDWSSVALNTTAYRAQISQAAQDFGVDAALLRALIHAESAFDANALSAKGAQGLTQLMPATAASLGVVDAFDVTQNIRGGAQYLAQLLKDFNGDERLAAAAYNAGPGAVRKYGGVPPYAETEVYVERVGILSDRYRKANGGTGSAVAVASP